MAWSEINPYRAMSLADAAAMALLKGDIEYLHKQNGTAYHHPGTGANYTVTGDLGQDLDAVNMKLPLVSTGGLVMAAFVGQFLCPAGGVSSIRASIIREDAVSHIGRNLFYNFDVQIWANAGQGGSRGWLKPFPNLPAGTHEFRLAWGVYPSGT